MWTRLLTTIIVKQDLPWVEVSLRFCDEASGLIRTESAFLLHGRPGQGGNWGYGLGDVGCFSKGWGKILMVVYNTVSTKSLRATDPG